MTAAAVVGVTAAPAAAVAAPGATGTATECEYTVTAAGDGQLARCGSSLSSPVAFMLHAGDSYYLLGKAGSRVGDGIVWRADPSYYVTGENLWYPTQDTASGTYYLVRIAGSCDVM
ncbi:MAG TPA: hypothetical protein VMB79_04135 [Jatrophihabitans sp.]|nr:hypothetical protein [Jatrophihabitans sp.]